MKIISGTTEDIYVRTNVDISSIKEIEIVLSDCTKEIQIVKNLIDCDEVDGNTLKVRLSDEETLQLNPYNMKTHGYCQVRMIDDDGVVEANSMLEFDIEPFLKEGVIEYEQ